MRERVNAKLATVVGDRDMFDRQFIRDELEANSARVKIFSSAKTPHKR